MAWGVKLPAALKPKVPAAPTPVQSYPTSFAGFIPEATAGGVPQNVIDDVASRSGLSLNSALTLQQQRINQLKSKWGLAQADIQSQVQAQAERLKSNKKYATKFYRGLDKANKPTDQELDKRLQPSSTAAQQQVPQLIGQFQQQFGLPVTGEYDDATRDQFRNLSRVSTLGKAGILGGKPTAYAGLAAFTQNPLQAIDAQVKSAKDARAQLDLIASQVEQPKQIVAGQPVKTNEWDQALGLKSTATLADRRKAAARIRSLSAGDDASAIRSLQQIKTQQEKTGANPITSAVGKGLETVFEPLQRSYYAGQLARNRGLGVGGEVRSFVGALPGLGFTAGSGAERRAIEATNTRAEREKLTKKGELASFGEVVSGKATEVLHGKFRDNYLKNTTNILTPGKSAQAARNEGQGQLPKFVEAAVSPALDLGFQVLTDPTLGPSSALHAASKPFQYVAEQAERDLIAHGALSGLGEAEAKGVSQRAVRAAMATLLDETPVGIALKSNVDRVLGSTTLSHDVGAIQTAFKGIKADVASKIAEASTREEARNLVYDALRTGEWNPKIRPLTGQLAIDAGLRDSVGRSAIRDPERIGGFRGLRAAGRGDLGRAAMVTHDARQIGEGAINSSLRFAEDGAHAWRGDFERSVIDEGKTVQRRAHDVLVSAAQDSTPGFTAYAQQRLAPFYKEGGSGLAGISENGILASVKLTSSPELTDAVREVESVKAILDGKAGAAAAEQMQTELTEGFLAKASRFDDLLAASRTNLGLTLTAEDVKAVGTKFTKSDVADLISDLPEALQVRAVDAFDGLSKPKDFRWFGAAIKDALSKPDVLAEAERLANIEEDRLGALADKPLSGLGPRGIGRRFARGVMSVLEEGEPAFMKLAPSSHDAVNIQQRVNEIQRVARRYELSEGQVSQLSREAARVQTEEDLFKLAVKPLKLAGRDAGLPDELLDQLVRGVRSNSQRSMAFGVNQETGELLSEGAITAAQKVETVTTPDVADLRQAIREELAKSGDVWSNIRVRSSVVGDISLFGLERNGKQWTVKLGAEAAHRLWKLLVVTNLHLPLLGALAGTIGAIHTGNPADILKGAAIGGAIGLAAPVRYVGRVAGMEEGFRKVLERGFKPQEWIPVVSKWSAEHGIAPGSRFVDEALVHSGANFGSSYEQRWLRSASEDWIVKEQGQKGFDEAWMRTVQYQLQPDAYTADRIMLGEAAGHITTEEADQLLKELKATDEGKLWSNRLGKSFKNAVSDQRQFIKDYVTTPELADARLNLGRGEDMDMALFKDAETKPNFVHAQSPKAIKARTLWSNYTDLTSRFVLSGATNTMNRNPLARHAYADEFNYLTRTLGMDEAKASSIATEHAVGITNDVMFKLDSESRFARKVDFAFPFQQPREEFLRVWTKLIARNPMRAVRVARLAAIGFNNGQNVDVFHENQYGEWVMTVPGSGYLSKLIGGFNGRFDVNLRDMFFVGQAFSPSDSDYKIAGLPATGFFQVTAIPTPGGPYWSIVNRQLVNEFPELFEKDNALTQWLMPYGPGGDLLRPESRRLWAGMTGQVAPWSFLDPEGMQGEFERSKIDVARALYAQNIKKGMTPDEAWPSDDEVRSSTQGLFKLWSFMGSVSPATPRPVYADKEQFQRVQDKLTLGGKVPLDYTKFRKDYPEYAPYLTATTKYVGPDDFEHWSEPLDVTKEFTLRYRDTVSFDEFKSDFKQYQKEQVAYDERSRLLAMPAGDEREKLLYKWSEDNPDLSKRSRESYFRDQDLARILVNYPKGQGQDAALDRWRTQYGVKQTQMATLTERAKTFIPNPWRESRDAPHIVKDVQRRVNRGANEEQVVSQLSPVEQHRYWDHKQNELSTNWTVNSDPQAVMDQYSYYATQKKAALAANPLLSVPYNKPSNRFDQYVADVKGQHSTALGALATEITNIQSAMDDAASNKRWTEYYSLKNKQQTLYDMKRAVSNDLYQRFPQLHDMYETMTAQTIALESGNQAKWKQLQSKLEKEKNPANFVPTNEEAFYLSLPDNIKKSYIETITNRLNAPSIPSAPKGASDDYYAEVGQVKDYLGEHNLSVLHWNQLTDFQQQLLTNNLSADQVRQWSLEDYSELQKLREKTTNVGGEAFDGNPDLQWAYGVLQQYDRRGGVNAPKSMGEYLNLPGDPGVRTQFLSKHPDLQGYLEATGYIDIPDADRFIVQNILTKYAPDAGQGSGNGYVSNGKGGYSSARPLDVQFAFEQLKLWNRRPTGAIAPDTYNAWVAMPSGQDKAVYLEQHPEIKDWLQLGPMANMPDQYKDIVRDIMQRYGVWTQQENPLGDTINQYYSTPAYMRPQFLRDHPELTGYWAALRSPDEQAMFDVTNNYFAIQDPVARRSYLASHPELQQHLVDQRNTRYQKFLNQVAIYMGENPEMFDQYLQRQTEILNELLRKFASAPLMREMLAEPKVKANPGRKRSTTAR